MNRPRVTFKALVVLGAVALAATALARPEPPRDLGRAFHDGGTLLHGGSAVAATASRDTVYLLGGPNRLDGKFQNAEGVPEWHGWTSVDLTAPPSGLWNVSTYRADSLGGHGPGNHALWCGATFPNACAEGYGDHYDTYLVWTHTVANPAVATEVNLQGVFHHDTEPAYDYLRLQIWQGEGWQTLLELDGAGDNVTLDETVVIAPHDYAGPYDAENAIWVRWQVTSDGAWSDEDCQYDSQGACQLDDLAVSLDGVLATFDDFEPGSPVNWHEQSGGAVGDFAHIWSHLMDVDPCAINLSPQVAFIDDGLVVPGTGGSQCVTWCYGPGGYVVNATGGLAGPGNYLDNAIQSPVLAVPDGYAGATLAFTAYLHETLSPVTPGIFANYEVRSTADPDPAALASADWENYDSFGWMGGPVYRRFDQRIEPLLEQSARWLQVRLRVAQYGWIWGWDGIDATPAPYFDNVAVKVFNLGGPSVSARDIDLAQDSFPGAGDIDLANLANNGVRFDMARNISPDAHLRNDPGDSLVLQVDLVRAGAVLEGLPRMMVKLKANPLFDGVRQLPPNFTQAGDIIDGWVEGAPTIAGNRYAFDLPDSTFFFPGDVIHYYFTAADNVNGQVGVTTLPDKLDGFGNYTGLMAYPNVFTVRALPTLFDTHGNQPEILFWNDAPDRGRDAQWFYALGTLGYNEHNDYDLYETNGASSGVGNGLGGRATPQTIGGYGQLLYTCGDLATYTMSNGDFDADPSNDIGVVSNWFQQGGKRAFMTGDDLVSSLASSGGASQSFLNSYLSVRFLHTNVLPYISNQTAPKVRRLPGNSVFTTPYEWLAYGGCPVINDFDAIEPNGPAERLAQFLTPSGNPGYTYSAASRYTNVADVIYMPYDFSFIQSTPGYVPSHPGYTVRAEILRDILIEFGALPGGNPVAVPDARTLTVTAGPNPFNPRTTIALDLPRAGEVSLRLYDIRGRLVRTLHDGQLAEGRHELVWFGDDDTGRALASGVYFYEVRAAGEERIGKLALVR